MNNEEKIIAMLEEQGKRLDKLETDVLGVRVLVDVDIDKKLNLLAEGHSAIIEQMIPVSRVEALESDVVVLKEAIKALSSRLKELEAKTA